MKIIILISIVILTQSTFLQKSSNKLDQFSALNPSAISAQDLLQIINAHQQAIKAADTAVNAYASAVASCQVNVSCGDAQNQLITAKSYQNTAVKASSQSEKALGSTISVADKVRSMIANLSNNNSNNNKTSDDEVNVKTAQSAVDVTELAVKQAQLAASATASAVATCEVIVNVVCNVCPNNNTNLDTNTNRRNITAPTFGNIFNDARTRLVGLN